MLKFYTNKNSFVKIMIFKDTKAKIYENVKLKNYKLYISYIKAIIFFINILCIQGSKESKYTKEDIYFEIIEPNSLHYTFKVRPAQDFGIPFNSSFHNVGLVISDPSHGCSALTNHLEVKNNIVLIDRGGCSFLSKCVQAEKAGVLAVMVCDNDISNDDQYIDMIDDTTKRNCNIPALFLLGKDGFMVKRNLEVHNLTRAIVNIPVNMTHFSMNEQRQPPWVLW